MTALALEVIRGVDQGRRYALALGPQSLGRGPSNAVVLNAAEKSVSAHHAILYVSEEKIILQDLQSTNGTFLNGRRIAQEDATPGDEIGFGKGGPRLRLVRVGESGDDARDRTDAVFAKGHTQPDDRAPPADRSATAGQPSLTTEYESKLREQRMNASDMRRLLRNGKRVEKLLQRDGLSDTHKSLLHSMYGARRLSRRQWLLAGGALLFVCVCLVTFFAVRASQYHAQLQQARQLEGKLRVYEKRIAALRATPDADPDQLRNLALALGREDSVFSLAAAGISDADFAALYADTVSAELSAILRRFGERNYRVPAEMAQRVKYHAAHYADDLHAATAGWLGREERYFPAIQAALRQKNLPPELAYITMVESGLDPQAESPVGAKGLWQLMPKTALAYRLRVDNQVDERTDVGKSSIAAAEYIRNLIGIFGGQSSIMLALAAYNAGENRLMGALKKIDDPMRNRDFWYVYRMGYLPDETNEYIPRVLALMIIDRNRERYGFPADEVRAAGD
jgi:soluble lytic murein transglycosylase-like protein